MSLLFACLGSLLSNVITIMLCFYGFNIVARYPSFFEPFFSPWHWILIYFIFNLIQLTTLFIITIIVAKLMKITFSISLYKYFILGFIFSCIYILGQMLFFKQFNMANNFLSGFILFPTLIYIVLFLSIISFKK